MLPQAALLAFVLIVLLPVTGIIAGIMAWRAFRSPIPRWRLVIAAVAVLVTPHVLAAVIEPKGGLAFTLFPSPVSIVSLFVAVGIVVASVRRLR